MSLKLPVTAVFDIGKTNKKFLLFDETLTAVHRSNKVFDEIEDDDGFPCDDLKALTDWIFKNVEEVVSDQNYDVKAINFSTYGATLVHLGRDGKPVTPLYNYLKPFPGDLADEFYQTFGGKESFVLETASPSLGMLNSGLQLYWLKKKKPGQYQKIEKSLHFPQYLSYLLTDKFASELTSIGCHTAMWNFGEKKYHQWLKSEGVLKLLPEIQPVQKSYPAIFENSQIKTGIGIHDSSAALVPYLQAFDEPFIQLSTGTWSIAMNPFTKDSLTVDDLSKDCLQYLNIYGDPVKASRFLLGGEYAHQREKMGMHFGKNPKILECDPDPVLIRKLAGNSGSRNKLILEKAYGSGPYPGNSSEEWDLTLFKSYEEAAHQCMLDLASIQADSVKLAQGTGEIDQIIITGGFAKNQFFCRLLASFMPDKSIFTALVPDASALGAALVMQDNFPKKQLKEMLKLNLQKPFSGVNIEGYSFK